MEIRRRQFILSNISSGGSECTSDESSDGSSEFGTPPGGNSSVFTENYPLDFAESDCDSEDSDFAENWPSSGPKIEFGTPPSENCPIPESAGSNMCDQTPPLKNTILVFGKTKNSNVP